MFLDKFRKYSINKFMTALLEKAIEQIKILTEKEQDIFAAFILERLESDWDKEIKKDFSKDGFLHSLLEEAKFEVKNNQTKEGGFNCL